jgi:hypothetical protein
MKVCSLISTNATLFCIKGSAKEFSFLFLLFGVFMVIFSALVYFAENGQNEKMNSIPGILAYPEKYS